MGGKEGGADAKVRATEPRWSVHAIDKKHA